MNLRPFLFSAALVTALLAIPAWADVPFQFNGHGDNETDAHGYYYIITGGIFTNGQTVNGDNASGGTFRFLSDDPIMYTPTDTWLKDDWFSDNAGFALTLENGGSTVYDNNGIKAGTYGDYYTEGGSHQDHGLYRGYSMANNFDFIYAGYFQLAVATTFNKIVGFFDGNGLASAPFNPYDPAIGYRMNIWSNVTGDLLPVNTGGFTGDVFSTGNAAGSFAVSDTHVVRAFSDGSTDPIYALTYTLNNPVTLQAGEYWFSHDASLVPEPASVLMLGTVLLALAGGLRRRFR